MKDMPSAPASPPATVPENRWDGHMSDGIGATYGPAPMAFLTATPEHLVLSGKRGTFHLPRTAVRKVTRGGFYPWFFAGVRIHHELPGAPADLQFKPLAADRRAVLAGLRSLGYPVS